MPLRVGINGFGAIGRRFYRIARRDPRLRLVAINDLGDIATMAHLLKYDSNYGILDAEVKAGPGHIEVDGHRIPVSAYRDPAEIPWRDLGVDVVVESTGRFTEREKAELHVTRGGAKKVVISAPAKNDDITIVLGVNEDQYDPARHTVISNASCTTNCLAPVTKVLDDAFGIEKGLMTTVHAYTHEQQLLDYPHRDLRRARAAPESIVPTSTGAAKAIHLVLPRLKGRMNGMAFRVPVPTVSVVDLVCVVSRDTTDEEVNNAYRAAAAGPLGKYLAVSDVPLVSVDFKGNDKSAIVDAPLTMVTGGNLVKVVAWYDNEWGYSARLAQLLGVIADRGV